MPTLMLVLVIISSVNVSGAVLAESPVLVAATERGVRIRETLRDCAGCPELVPIPGGVGIIGSPPNERGRYPEEGPQRRVTISAFYAGKFDVTRGQWRSFVVATKRRSIPGCAWSGRANGKPDSTSSWWNLGFAQEDNHPVVCITWKDAQDYVRWLSERTRKHYRLFTEAEWEYAARAGTVTPFPWGSSPSHDRANYGGKSWGSGLASGRDRWVYTSPVGSFPPNALGLYDMHGNVLQWVQDCFSKSYSRLSLDGSANERPIRLRMTGELAEMNGHNSCEFRMLRGGDWGDPPAAIRSAARNWGPPPGLNLRDYRSGAVGFRVARSR